MSTVTPRGTARWCGRRPRAPSSYAVSPRPWAVGGARSDRQGGCGAPDRERQLARRVGVAGADRRGWRCRPEGKQARWSRLAPARARPRGPGFRFPAHCTGLLRGAVSTTSSLLGLREAGGYHSAVAVERTETGTGSGPAVSSARSPLIDFPRSTGTVNPRPPLNPADPFPDVLREIHVRNLAVLAESRRRARGGVQRAFGGDRGRQVHRRRLAVAARGGAGQHRDGAHRGRGADGLRGLRARGGRLAGGAGGGRAGGGGRRGPGAPGDRPQRPQPRLRQRSADHAAAARRPRPLSLRIHGHATSGTDRPDLQRAMPTQRGPEAAPLLARVAERTAARAPRRAAGALSGTTACAGSGSTSSASSPEIDAAKLRAGEEGELKAERASCATPSDHPRGTAFACLRG